MAERLRQYESLRRQALESERRDTSDPVGLARAFLECRGLVAWQEHVADAPSARMVSIEEQTSKQREGEVSPGDLVLALASRVVGERQEVQHG